MYFKLMPVVLALVAGATIALADDETPAADGVAMTYEAFEDVVPHADLAECPDEFADQEVFCRLTLAHDQLNVVVFSEEGDQPMVAVRQVDLEKNELTF